MRAIIFGLTLNLLIGIPAIARPPADRGYAGGHEVLEINGKTVFVTRLAGGNVVAEAIEETRGNDMFPGKHPGPAHVEPIVAEMPADAVSDALGDVLRDFLTATNKTFGGSILVMNADMRPVEQRQFDNAMISEVRFDALDAGSKEAAKAQVKIAPGTIRSVPAADSAPKVSPEGKSQKRLLASNFRVAIPSVDCSKVSHVEPIVITRAASEVGKNTRDAMDAGGKMSCANLVMTVSEAGAKDFVDWHRQCVVEGKTGPEMEKTATIELLSQNMKDVELTLEANGVGILAVRPVANEPGSESVRRVAVEMYVERWALKPPGGSNATENPENPPAEGSTPKKPAPRRKPG
jgi:hypothetical protein